MLELLPGRRYAFRVQASVVALLPPELEEQVLCSPVRAFVTTCTIPSAPGAPQLMDGTQHSLHVRDCHLRLQDVALLPHREDMPASIATAIKQAPGLAHLWGTLQHSLNVRRG